MAGHRSGFHRSQARFSRTVTPPRLSRRERQVVEGIAAGKSSKQIASDLSLQEATIRTHRLNIFRRFGVEKAPELVAMALERGLIAFAAPDLSPAARCELIEQRMLGLLSEIAGLKESL